MIREKSQQLIELSQKSNALRKYAKHLEGFKTREKEITDAVAGILPLVSALRAFRQKGITDFDLTQKADAILAIIAVSEAKFQENPEWIIDNKNFKGNILNSSVQGLKNTLKEYLCGAWKSYLTQHMPSTNKEMLNLLAGVEAFKPTVQRIRNLDNQIQQVEFPKSSEEFERVDRLIDQLSQAWNSLSSDEVPEAVLSLLRAAANQGAKIDLLTLEVKDWLIRHRMADSLRIKLT